MFKAHIDLGLNQMSIDSIPSGVIVHRKYIFINGVKTILHRKAEQLTRLICFLNPKGFRKIRKKPNFTKVNLIESTSLNSQKIEKEMEYPYIAICLKFENAGNYFIIVSDKYQFYVQIKGANEDRCVLKIFKKMCDLDKEFFKSLRQYIKIKILKTKIDNIEDGKMNVYNYEFFGKYILPEFVADIVPMFTDGSYEFYLDGDGHTTERV
ncbi:unnamed protein product [Meloidogyne enterolobii]|uniref:Uncharacterized protein n=1 Tax=Meloidogyne enterolobii TaxID=390850 RepID=A0ACB1AC81_MELEN